MNRKGKPPARSKTYHLQVLIELDEDGKYVAWCPALEACYTQGDTFEEAVENIRDVITLCLDELREEKKPIDLRYPEVIGLKHIEVTV
jgi:predicted RNase H-like HicB family nuclease